MKIKERPIQKTFKMKSIKKTKSAVSKKTEVKRPKKKIDLKKMSVDEFLSGGYKEVDDTPSQVKVPGTGNGGTNKLKKKKKETLIKKNKKKNVTLSKNGVLQGVKTNPKQEKDRKASRADDGEEADSEEENEEESVESNDDEGEEITIKKHKEQLDGLKTTDPEFYKYLKEHDEDLLNFDDSDSDEKEEEQACHKPPDSLEVASDESDFEPEDGAPSEKDKRNITLQMVTALQEKLPKAKNRKIVRDAVDAFHAALLRVSGDPDKDLFRFKVDGSPVFNAIIRMCVMDMYSGIRSVLKIPQGSRISPTQCKPWPRVKPMLRMYFTDLTELTGVTSASMLTVLLKHIHQMCPFITYFPNIAPLAIKRMVDLWSKSEDVVRVLSFLCILRLTNHNRSLLSFTLKRMYLTYVRNTKFMSPNTIPEINFMRQSLAEMFALDESVSYQMAFVYIRQLAVHLRNAVTLKKKENYQVVYNWQFVSSLHLWAELVGMVSRDSTLKSLVYPLVQIIIGTIKLIPSPQYYPLRFHCCKLLISISHKCGVFIPVLPFLLEVLQDFDFNREHKKLSMKPMNMTCLLRCTKVQMKENGFRDALIENINNLLIEFIGSECFRISFPDIFVPAVLQLKQFIKECKVMNYTKIMKALLDKILENSKYIEEERKKLNFKLNDTEVVEAIEMGIKVKGTPFLTYYENWKKIYLQLQAKKVVENIKLDDYKLPVIYKLDKKRSRAQSRSVGPPELFPSDSEDSNISFGVEGKDEPKATKNKERNKKRRTEDKTENSGPSKPDVKKPLKKVKRQLKEGQNFADEDDVVEDLKLSDIE